jgi:sigma-B regulation protein RsbU (phosphoserine phosphatase)
MIAGMVAGPIGGIGAGLIGGVHRYAMGGITVVPCTIATVLAGLFGGAIYLKYHRRFASVTVAVAFAVLMECFHMLLALLLVRPFDVAVAIVSASAGPMIVANAIGMAAFALVISAYLRTQEAERGPKES